MNSASKMEQYTSQAEKNIIVIFYKQASYSLLLENVSQGNGVFSLQTVSPNALDSKTKLPRPIREENKMF